MSEIRSPWYVGAIRAAHAPLVIALGLEPNKYGSRLRRLAAHLPDGSIIAVGVDAEGAPAGIHPLGRPDFYRLLITTAETSGAALVGHRLAALAEEIIDDIPPGLRARYDSLIRADIHEAAAILSERDPGSLGGSGSLGLRDLAARIGLDLGPDEGPPPVFVDLRATERVWNELLAPRLRPRFALDAIISALAVSDTSPPLTVGPVVCADVRIPVAFAERASKSTASLARKAARMDLPVPELVFSDEKIELVEFDTGISGYVKTIRALLSLPTPPTVDRWRFVARIDNPGGILAENLLVRVPGTSDPIPEHYRTAKYRACDHCGKQRARRETFLVTDGAQWHQLGRDCLGDFMHRDPGAVLVYLEALGRIIPDDEDVRSGMSAGFRDGRLPALYPMRDIIELTTTIASLDGWVSRDTARRAYEEENRHLTTTASCVERLLALNGASSQSDRLWAARYVSSEKSASLRDATFAALDDLSTRSSLVEWERSLLTLWGAGFTDRIHLPLAASAVVLGRRRLAEAEKLEAQKAAAVAPNPPHFLGTAGERLRNLTVEVTYERESDSDFGPRRYVLSRALDGSLIEWWMNIYPEVTKGDRLSLTGTVKNHRWLDRSGEPVTTLNRVAIADPPPPPEPARPTARTIVSDETVPGDSSQVSASA